jgi:hypothetical protein
MRINYRRGTRINRIATIVLLTVLSFQLTAGSQPLAQDSTTTKTGATALVALAPGDTLRFTAFNPAPAGEAGEPISMRMSLYNEQGRVIANSAEVTIPPGEFRTISFRRDELPLAGEPGTGILQVRTVPLWHFTSNIRVKVTTSLEVMPAPGGTTSGSFKFYFNVETLP